MSVLSWARRASGLLLPGQLPFAGYPCCTPPASQCPCSHADTPATTPCCFKVTLAGFGNAECRRCACYNRDYYLAWTQESGGVCNWDRPFRHPECTRTIAPAQAMEDLSLDVYQDGSDYKLKVYLDQNYTWEKNYGAAKPDLASLSDESIPYVSGSGLCDGSAATCKVTSLALSADCPADYANYCRACDCSQRRFIDRVMDPWQATLAGFTGAWSGLNGVYQLDWSWGCKWEYLFDPPVDYPWSSTWCPGMQITSLSLWLLYGTNPVVGAEPFNYSTLTASLNHNQPGWHAARSPTWWQGPQRDPFDCISGVISPPLVAPPTRPPMFCGANWAGSTITLQRIAA